MISEMIDVPLAGVWRAAADLAGHVEWMTDAESIRFEGEQTSGVGTRMVVATRVGPLRISDLLEVVEWQEPRVIGVRHRGVVTGYGRFELTPLAGRTRFTWREELKFPWWMGGAVTALVAKPLLSAIWRRNLQRFKQHVEISYH